MRPPPGLGVYGASKAALNHLTKQLALELAPKVRVNAVVPALSRRTWRIASTKPQAEVVRAYPLGRLGRPEDVAAAVAFLASPDASWITGETLLIDGGLALTGGVA